MALPVNLVEIEAGLAAVDKLVSLVEELPFLPDSAKHVLADLQKGLEFAEKLAHEI
jgi:hypothetical protein